MRKNKTMRAATLLLALTLITSCFVGGTFAKYITKTGGSDDVRVAYWGFHSDGTGLELDLFDAEYDGTVKSENGDNVIAPGTEKKVEIGFRYVDSTLDGVNAPEVDYTLDFNISAKNEDGSELTNAQWLILNNMGWNLYINGEAVDIPQSFQDLAAYLEDYLLDGTYEAGTLPKYMSGESTDKLELGWAWDYEFENAATTAGQEQDRRDTAIGNSDYGTKTIVVTIEAVATQVD